MYSHRLDWSAARNRLAEELALAPPRLDLTVSNPTTAGLNYSQVPLLNRPASLVYEPNPMGLPAARRVLGLPFDATFLSASTSEAYGWLFKLLCDPGDEVLIPAPSYPLFEFLAGLESVKVRQYPLRYAEGWWIDFDALQALLTSRTRAILCVNPNNPTGSYIKRPELHQLATLCARHELALISDEVFAEYHFAADETRCLTLGNNGICLTFAMGGLSKTAGLPQMKAAWTTVSGPGAADAIERLEIIADTYLSIATPVQHGLSALLEAGAGIRQQIQSRTRHNLAYLQQTDLRPLQVEGGWYAIIPTPRTKNEEEWALHLLQQHSVLVQPGYFYDFETDGWLVLSLLTPQATFEAGVAAIVLAFG